MEKGIWCRRDYQVRTPTLRAYHLSKSCRNFDFKEKLEVNKYYPQYYHKTDKVRPIFTLSEHLFIYITVLLGWSAGLYRTARIT